MELAGARARHARALTAALAQEGVLAAQRSEEAMEGGTNLYTPLNHNPVPYALRP